MDDNKKCIHIKYKLVTTFTLNLKQFKKIFAHDIKLEKGDSLI